jgi:uncharacterized protein (TIGR02996 family)
LNTDESAFLSAIHADPSDALTRRLYADWLEEQGQKWRAECLRAELAAAGIVGATNLLGILDVERHFRRPYAEEELRLLAEIPFSEATLVECKDTHVLFPGAPLSLVEIRTLALDACWLDWYDWETFGSDRKVGCRWHLLLQQPMPLSCGRSYDQQCAILANEEEVPFACEVTYMVMLYWLTHHERLLPDVYVRCRDNNTSGQRILVGAFHSFGTNVCTAWDWSRVGYIGLAPIRKP